MEGLIALASLIVMSVIVIALPQGASAFMESFRG
jgi:hypothetical protein